MANSAFTSIAKQKMYVGPGGSTQWGTNWRWPGAPAAAQTAPTPPTASKPVTIQLPNTAKPPDPFLTPDQEIQKQTLTGTATDQYNQILDDIRKATAALPAQKAKIDQDAKKASGTATDDAIARGLFRSSIKDANLYDIEAQRNTAKQYLDDNITMLTTQAQTRASTLFGPGGTPDHITGGTVGALNATFDREAVQNAQDVPVAPTMDAKVTPNTPTAVSKTTWTPAQLSAFAQAWLKLNPGKSLPGG